MEIGRGRTERGGPGSLAGRRYGPTGGRGPAVSSCDGNAADAVLLSSVAGGLLAGLALLVAVGADARIGLVGALCAALPVAFAAQAAMAVVEGAAWARYGVALAPAFAGLGIAVWCAVDAMRTV